jgi:hypothetical protein
MISFAFQIVHQPEDALRDLRHKTASLRKRLLEAHLDFNMRKFQLLLSWRGAKATQRR